MEHSYLDEYSQINSFIHSLEPRIKIIGFFAFILFVIFTPLKTIGQPPDVKMALFLAFRLNSFTAFALYGLLIIVLIILSKIPVLFFLKRSGAIIPFVLLVAIFLPFVKPGEPIYEYSYGSAKLSISREGLAMFCSILIKAYLSILSMTLLIATTNFSNLLKALEKLKFHSVFIMVISFMYRYLFILQDELMHMKQAKESRTVGGSRWFHLKASSNMVGVLFIRAYERAEDIYLAMCSRGFEGRINTIYDFKIRTKDICFLLTLICILGLIRMGWVK